MHKELPFIARIKLRRLWLESVVTEGAETGLKQVVRDLNRLQDEGFLGAEVDEIIQGYVPDDVLCLPGAGILRQRLSADMRIRLYLRATPRNAALTDETARLTGQASAEYAERFWLEVGKHAEYRALLGRYAPVLLQDQPGAHQSTPGHLVKKF